MASHAYKHLLTMGSNAQHGLRLIFSQYFLTLMCSTCTPLNDIRVLDLFGCKSFSYSLFNGAFQIHVKHVKPINTWST